MNYHLSALLCLRELLLHLLRVQGHWTQLQPPCPSLCAVTATISTCRATLGKRMEEKTHAPLKEYYKHLNCTSKIHEMYCLYTSRKILTPTNDMIHVVSHTKMLKESAQEEQK